MPANMEQEFGGATSHSETSHLGRHRDVTSQHLSSASTPQQPLRPEEKKGCMTSGHATGTSIIQRHPEYFFADGNVIFQVEETQYKIHRSMLERHSTVFREMFMMPQPEGSAEGLSEDCPIVLAGVRALDFSRLLQLLYPPILGLCEFTTVDEWISVMDQADRWQMDALRSHAIERVKQFYISPIRKIILWGRYDLPIDEVIPSYVELVSRPRSLSLDEAREAGLHMVVKIASARESAHREGVCGCCSSAQKKGYSAARDAVLYDIVKTTFNLPKSSPATL